jgi:hypothetical protein
MTRYEAQRDRNHSSSGPFIVVLKHEHERKTFAAHEKAPAAKTTGALIVVQQCYRRHATLV